MNTLSIQDVLDKAICELSKKGTKTVHAQFEFHSTPIHIELMIEKSQIWFLSHNDRSKLKIEDINQYLIELTKQPKSNHDYFRYYF